MSRVDHVPSRRERLIQYLADHGTTTVANIVQELGVSGMTVHRDLSELARQGRVRRFRGSVSVQPSAVFESNFEYRVQSQVEAKRKIAAAAIGLIEPGMSLILDDSTTTIELARRLGAVGSLTVITNSVEIVKVLATEDIVRLVVLPGEYDRRFRSLLGHRTIEALEAIWADVSFISAPAVHGHVVCHQIEGVGSVKVAMMRRALRRALLVDHTKFEKIGVYQIADLVDFQYVVTDDGASSDVLGALRAGGIEPLVASAGAAGEELLSPSFATKAG